MAFLLAGLLPWNLIGSGLPAAMGALVGNAGLVKKVRFRRDSLVIASVAAAGVTLLIELFVLGAVMLVLGHRSVLPFIPAIVGLVVLESLFLLGIGLVLAAANVYFRDLQYLTNIGLMAWMYLSPLLYPITFVPVHGRVFGHRLPLRFLLRLNPMARFLGAFRETMYDLRYPSLNTWLSLIVSAAVVLWIGFAVFHRLQGRFAEEL